MVGEILEVINNWRRPRRSDPPTASTEDKERLLRHLRAVNQSAGCLTYNAGVLLTEAAAALERPGGLDKVEAEAIMRRATDLVAALEDVCQTQVGGLILRLRDLCPPDQLPNRLSFGSGKDHPHPHPH